MHWLQVGLDWSSIAIIQLFSKTVFSVVKLVVTLFYFYFLKKSWVGNE